MQKKGFLALRPKLSLHWNHHCLPFILCLLLSVTVNNVGVMYDYPQKFLDVPVEVRFYKVNEFVFTLSQIFGLGPSSGY